jgi:SlyX protein
MLHARAIPQNAAAPRWGLLVRCPAAVSTDETQARLTDLETRLAYQEHTLEKLDAVIAAQARSIASLQAGLDRLARRMDGLQQDALADESQQRPPHY